MKKMRKFAETSRCGFKSRFANMRMSGSKPRTDKKKIEMKYTYVPSGVCSRSIEFEIDDNNVLRNVTFTGGCAGNTRGITALAEGRQADDVCRCLQGIDCKGRGTSCPDQLAHAIAQAMETKRRG